MKLAISILAMSLSLAVNANVEGTYKHVRPFAVFNYQEQDCKEEGGSFDDGVCFFKDGGSTIEIKNNTKGSFDLSITSVGTNFHFCDYQGEATQAGPKRLTSNDFNAEYPGTCELNVFVTSKDTIAIETNGKCQDYCGANMSLDIENATRKK